MNLLQLTPTGRECDVLVFGVNFGLSLRSGRRGK